MPEQIEPYQGLGNRKHSAIAVGDIGSSSRSANQMFAIDLSTYGFQIGDQCRIGNALVRGDLSSEPGEGDEWLDVGINSPTDPKVRLAERGYDDSSVFRTDGSLIDRVYTIIDIGGGVPGLEVYVSPGNRVSYSPSGMPNGWYWQLKLDVLED